jgi:hypothetical protein
MAAPASELYQLPLRARRPASSSMRRSVASDAVSGQCIEREEARLRHFHRIRLGLALGAGGEEVNGVAPSFRAVGIIGDEVQLLHLQADFLLHFARRRVCRALAPADAAAGQHEQVGRAIAVADQQDVSGLVEHHYLGTAGADAQQAVGELAQAVGNLEERVHHLRS